MAQMIQIKLAEQSCSAGIRYAEKQATTPPKDAVICCEGMCLKGRDRQASGQSHCAPAGSRQGGTYMSWGLARGCRWHEGPGAKG